MSCTAHLYFLFQGLGHACVQSGLLLNHGSNFWLDPLPVATNDPYG